MSNMEMNQKRLGGIKYMIICTTRFEHVDHDVYTYTYST
jgi:hypothetical protein